MKRTPFVFSPITLIKYLLPALLLVAFFIRWNYEFYFEIAAYSREWTQQEIKNIEPLSDCFDPHHISPTYNISDAIYGPKLFHVHAGIPMRIGTDCYDYAGTIRMQPFHPKRTRHVNVHSYWRADLVPFGNRQEQTLKSFFATQDLNVTKLILWSNGDLRGTPYIDSWLQRYPNSFEVRIVDIEEWVRGTALEGSHLLKATDDKAWIDGDLIRLLVMWVHGGVWLDMDSLLTRDLTPLLEHEFVTQWDCFGMSLLSPNCFPGLTDKTSDKIYQTLNGALMHFFQRSPYLCEAFHVMARSNPPRPGSTDWGSLLYLKLWRKIVAGGIPPFKILPFCFSDGRSCQSDPQLPDPFKEDPRSWRSQSLQEGGVLNEVLGKVFAVHLHNHWESDFPIGGWVDRLLLRRYDSTLKQHDDGR
jgi:Glycosyltransferase sugar-binding region containing DXD motif